MFPMSLPDCGTAHEAQHDRYTGVRDKRQKYEQGKPSRPHALIPAADAEDRGDKSQGNRPNVAQEVYLELAEVLVRLTDYEEALRVLAQCDRATAQTPAALALRAESYWNTSRTARAWVEFVCGPEVLGHRWN